MAKDEGKTKKSGANSASGTANSTSGENPSLIMHAQYIKDLSFESPNPIGSFTAETKAQPNISVSIQAKAANLGGRNFEVVMDLSIKATREDKPLFSTDLSYAALVSLGEKVQETEAEKLLMVEAPQLFFPFARNIISDVTRNGGFPPVMLAPVDFSALYEQQKNQAAS